MSKQNTLDARLLILGVTGWTAMVVILQAPVVLAGAFCMGVLAARGLGATWTRLFQRLGVLNLFFLPLLPLVAVESFAFSDFPWHLDPDRMRVFAVAVLRANAILAAVQGVAAAVTLSDLGAALAQWRCPPKLAHLLMCSARYIDVLQSEWRTSVQAARLRGFRMRLNLRAWRSLGILTGGLLLRSLDHADTLLAAMKCRGYDGRFHALKRLRSSRADVVSGLLLAVVCAMLVWLDRMQSGRY